MKKNNYSNENIRWNATNDPEYPFQAVYDGDELLIRLNDFPADALYTLIVNGEEVADFDDLAPNWTLTSVANNNVYHGIAD
jgi:diadenosine tetraphosphate (Ap4A) HIT family hydrolase